MHFNKPHVAGPEEPEAVLTPSAADLADLTISAGSSICFWVAVRDEGVPEPPLAAGPICAMTLKSNFVRQPLARRSTSKYLGTKHAVTVKVPGQSREPTCNVVRNAM